MLKGKYVHEMGKSKHAEGLYVYVKGTSRHADRQLCVCEGQECVCEGQVSECEGQECVHEGQGCESVSVCEGQVYVHEVQECVCEGTYMYAMCKNVCVMGKYVKGKNMCVKGKDVHAMSKNAFVKGKDMHAEGGWPTKQFLHMLLGIGHSCAGHHKAGVRVVAALTQPTKPPQDKGSVTSKHSPAQQLSSAIRQCGLKAPDSCLLAGT